MTLAKQARSTIEPIALVAVVVPLAAGGAGRCRDEVGVLWLTLVGAVAAHILRRWTPPPT